MLNTCNVILLSVEPSKCALGKSNTNENQHPDAKLNIVQAKAIMSQFSESHGKGQEEAEGYTGSWRGVGGRRHGQDKKRVKTKN